MVEDPVVGRGILPVGVVMTNKQQHSRSMRRSSIMLYSPLPPNQPPEELSFASKMSPPLTLPPSITHSRDSEGSSKSRRQSVMSGMSDVTVVATNTTLTRDITEGNVVATNTMVFSDQPMERRNNQGNRFASWTSKTPDIGLGPVLSSPSFDESVAPSGGRQYATRRRSSILSEPSTPGDDKDDEDYVESSKSTKKGGKGAGGKRPRKVKDSDAPKR